MKNDKEEKMKTEEINENLRYILEGAEPSKLYANGKFSNEQVDLISQLDAKINNPDSKDQLWELIGSPFLYPCPKIKFVPAPLSITRRLVYKYSDYCFMVFLRSNKQKEALDSFLLRIGNYSSVTESNYRIFYCLLQVLLNEPNLFSDEHLKKIEGIVLKFSHCICEARSLRRKKIEEEARKQDPRAVAIEGLLGATGLSSPQVEIPFSLPPDNLINNSDILLSQIRAILIKVRYKRVKQKLKGVNLEINQDKKQLIGKYKELRFSSSLIEALEKIDTELEETGSKFDYSKSIGFVRNIYEESMRQIAKKLEAETERHIPSWTGKGKIREAINYFRQISFITDKEESMLGSLVGFLSDTGSHSLTSERNEVRIAKNIIIEICYYLSDKIDKFLK